MSLTETGKEYRNWLTAEIQAKVSEILDRLDEQNLSEICWGNKSRINRRNKERDRPIHRSAQ